MKPKQTTGISGWNVILKAALARLGGVANLGPAISVSPAVVRSWTDGSGARPTPRAVQAMRRLL